MNHLLLGLLLLVPVAPVGFVLAGPLLRGTRRLRFAAANLESASRWHWLVPAASALSALGLLTFYGSPYGPNAAVAGCVMLPALWMGWRQMRPNSAWRFLPVLGVLMSALFLIPEALLLSASLGVSQAKQSVGWWNLAGKRAAPAMVAAIDTSDPEARTLNLLTLNKLDAGREEIRAAVLDKDEGVSASAVALLVQNGDVDRDLLRRALKNSGDAPSGRRAQVTHWTVTVQALAKVADAEALRDIIDYIAGKQVNWPRSTTFPKSLVFPAEAIDGFRQVLADGDEQDRFIAVNLLAGCEHPDRPELLIASGRDASPLVRQQVAMQLGSIQEAVAERWVQAKQNPKSAGEPVAVPDKKLYTALIAMRKDPDPRVREQVAASIRTAEMTLDQLEPQHLGPEVAYLRRADLTQAEFEATYEWLAQEIKRNDAAANTNIVSFLNSRPRSTRLRLVPLLMRTKPNGEAIATSMRHEAGDQPCKICAAIKAVRGKAVDHSKE